MPYKDPTIRREKQREADRRYRARHPDRVKATKRAYRERNAEALSREQRERNRDRLKANARGSVHRAIARGELVRGSCEGCGSTENVHGHHDDYAKPLDVCWLCPVCHAAVHA